MNLDSETQKKIKAYLDDEMTDIERDNFEDAIKNNEHLADTISILKTMDNVYNDNDWALYDGEVSKLKAASKLFTGDDISSFSKNVKDAESRYYINDKKGIRYLIKYVSSFAAAVCLLFLGYYFLGKEPSSLELYNDYYNQRDLPSFTTKSETANILSKAENLFKTRHYNEALEMFISVENKQYSAVTPNLTLYIAACHLELSQYNSVHERLDALLKSNTLDSHKAYWFKALTYLKEENKIKAIETLNLLVKNEKHFNYDKAKALLKALKS